MTSALHERFCTFLFSALILLSPQVLFAQCANPLSLDDILANIDLGFSVDHSNPQPPAVLASQGEIVRGFLNVERGDIRSQQCESDHFYTFLWIGTGGDTLEDRMERLQNFRDRMSGFDFFVDDQPIAAERIIETAPRDGFRPTGGDPLAYILVGWIAEPFEIVRGPHTGRMDINFIEPAPGVVSLPFEFDVITGDNDLDGIENGIDGTFDGAFNDQSDLFSDSFTDQHTGGTTRGTIFVRGDNEVMVSDNELAGVSLSANGGAGVSLFQLCGPANADVFNLLLTDGDRVTVTCGSLTGEVLSGPVMVTVGVNIEVTLPDGAKALLETLPGGLLSVSNLSGPGGPEILVDDGNGATPVGPDDPPLVTEVDDGLPDTPSGLTGRAKRGKVNLRWAPVEADSYDVFRALQQGGPYAMIGTTTRNVFVESGLAIGETYYYVVQAVNDIGNSENSNEAEVRTAGRRRR